MKNLPKKVKVGDKFNKLTVLSVFFTKIGKYNRTYCKCLCECGNSITTRGDSLNRKRTQSCGCFQKEVAKNNWIKSENSLYNEGSNVLFNNYKSSALRRGHEFSINRDIFQILTSSNCYYCNRTPSSISRRGSKTLDKDKIYHYNGLDRKDSNKGYVENNVVTCCQICNLAKSDLTEDEFYSIIVNIYNHRKLEQRNEVK